MNTSVGSIKARLPDFSRPEIRVAALLCLYNFLAMCAFCVIKPVRSALLLDRMGLVGLLISYMGAAAVTGVVIAATGFVSRRLPARFAVLLTTGIFLVNLLVFRQLFDAAGDWVALAFYIWANLFSNVLFTQFWLLAGNQFTPREGKQLFGWVSAGGTVGGIAGSVVVFAGIEALGTETVNLIYFSIFFLAACLPIIFYFERKGGLTETAEAGVSEASLPRFSLFREFRHLKLIALVSGVSMIVQTVVDYQFNAVVDASFASAEEKAAFFAQFFAGVNVVGLFFQLVLTRMILMRFGIGVALFLLPSALLAGSVGILLFPILWVAVAARMGEAGTRYSIQEATREILYLPLPAAVRSKARPLIDILGARFFEGVGGLLVLVCTVVLGFSVSALSVVSIVLITLWGITVFSVRHAYVDTLRDLFSETPVQPSERVAEVLDEDTVALLLQGLDSKDEVQVCQNLVLLDLMNDKTPILPQLKKTMAHSSAAVRAQVLDLLGSAGESGFEKEARALLEDNAGDVRIAAVRYLRLFGGTEALGDLLELADDEDLRVRVVAIGAMAQAGKMSQDHVLEALDDLWEGSGEDAESGRAEAAQILCDMNDPACDVVMMRLLADESPVVVRAALEGVSQTGRRFFVPLIVPYLADDRLMLYAQRALLAYGERVLGTLRDYMDDPDEDVQLKHALPGCLAAIGTQQAVRVLLAFLQNHQATLGEPIIDALDELRRQKVDLVFDEVPVWDAILRETASENKGDREVRLRRVVGLLALIYSPEDIHRAYTGLTSDQRSVRSNALELLDNLLKPEHKRDVLPAIEGGLVG